jgi:hypothetical protein
MFLCLVKLCFLCHCNDYNFVENESTEPHTLNMPVINIPQGAESLLWIRKEVDAYAGTFNPVSAILEVTIETGQPSAIDPLISESRKKRKASQESARSNIMNLLKQRLANGVIMNDNADQDHPALVFRCNPNASGTTKHFITRSPYSDVVKARAIKRAISAFNQEISDGTITSLLSRPLDYLASH